MLNEDSFIEVVEAVEAAGGELIPETHIGEEIQYTIEGPHGRKVKRNTMTTACGAEALVQLPHQREVARGQDGKLTNLEVPVATALRVCISCDRMDLWPRFSSEAVG